MRKDKRGSEHYRWNGGRRVHGAGYILVSVAGHPRADMHGYVYEHVIVAEKALGGYLPVGAEVHHVNERKSCNDNSNLVICDSHAYHSLLHARARALRATGSVHSVKCYVCKKWNLPGESDLTVRDAAHGSYHRHCVAEINRPKYFLKKEK